MKVSVIIPSFNAERFIAQTIRSVLAQSLPAHEIIVVDDGSTDGTAEIVQAFAPDVIYTKLGHGGACRVRNHGASLSSGDSLMFLDADDVLGPDVLHHLAAALRTAPQGIALCAWNRLERSGERWVRRPASCAPRVPGDDVLGAWLCGWYHPPCSVLWSRAAYELSGGWDEGLPGNPNDDGDIIMRALVRGASAVVTDSGTAFYRKHDAAHASLSDRRYSAEGLRDRITVLVRLAEMLTDQGRLQPYRTHFGAAFDQLARDCQEHAPALAPECRQFAYHFGGRGWWRGVRRTERGVRTRGAEILRLIRRPGAWARRRREKRDPVPVRYGLGQEFAPGLQAHPRRNLK